MDHRAFCRVAECLHPAWRDGLCFGHHKRRQRGQTVNTALREQPSAFERLIVAANDLAEASAEDDAEFKATILRLRKAAAAWLREMGWKPPEAEPAPDAPEGERAA